jgi:alcohol dehydrogenase YqhD (iron-dependent ADH family)
LNKRLTAMNLLWAAVFIAGVLRATADIDAWNFKRWIHFSSGLWVVAAAAWLVIVFPKLWRAPAAEPAYKRPG